VEYKKKDASYNDVTLIVPLNFLIHNVVARIHGFNGYKILTFKRMTINNFLYLPLSWYRSMSRSIVKPVTSKTSKKTVTPNTLVVIMNGREAVLGIVLSCTVYAVSSSK